MEPAPTGDGPDVAGRSRVPLYAGHRQCVRYGGVPTASWLTIKARVQAGRLVVDEPTDVPGGTEVDLPPSDCIT